MKRVLDAFLLRHLPAPHRDEPLVARVLGLLADDATDNLAHAAGMAGIDVRTLRRVAKRYFGFPPKLLLMRSRIVRAVVPMLLADDRDDAPVLPAFYHDASHFNRDGRRFLGMTPRRFGALAVPYLKAVPRARRLVIGRATPALDATPSPAGPVRRRPIPGNMPAPGERALSYADDCGHEAA